MDIDDAGHDREPTDVNALVGRVTVKIPDRDDAITLDADIGNYWRLVKTAEDSAADEPDIDTLLNRTRLATTRAKKRGCQE
jgi:hypothetical protein